MFKMRQNLRTGSSHLFLFQSYHHFFCKKTIGDGVCWTGRAIARPLFGPNWQAMLIALPLFAAQKWKKNQICTAQQQAIANLLSSDAFCDQKMHQNAFAAGALPLNPRLGSLQRSPQTPWLDLREPIRNRMGGIIREGKREEGMKKEEMWKGENGMGNMRKEDWGG